MSSQIIQRYTQDDLKLTGFYTPGETSKTVSILIHGFTSDPYTHAFWHTITTQLAAKQQASILIQTRGTGLQTEFVKKDGSGSYLGSYFERIEEAHLDITSFIEFLIEQGYQSICLIGHSLGTIKAVRYLFEGKYQEKISKLVLLAPFDKNAFIEKKAGKRWDEYLKIAQEKVQQGQGLAIVPIPEWEDFAISYQTFYSWYNRSDLSCLWDFYRKDYNFPYLHKIKLPVLVILGDQDESITYPEFGVDSKMALSVIKKHLPQAQTVLIPNCNHTYWGHHDQIGREVSQFV